MKRSLTDMFLNDHEKLNTTQNPLELYAELKDQYHQVSKGGLTKYDWYVWSRQFNRKCSNLGFNRSRYQSSLNFLFILWTIMNNIIDNPINTPESIKSYKLELTEIETIFLKEIEKLNE